MKPALAMLALSLRRVLQGMSHKVVVAFALSSLLAACQSAPRESAPMPTTAVLRSQWQCGDLRVQADFDTGNADRVTLAFDGRQLILPHAVAASGARYADATGNEFWTKGGEGRLNLQGQPGRTCVRSDDAASPWDAAAARGIRFRAVGNEPGWLVEVGGGKTPQLRAQLDYGQRMLDIAATEASPDHYRGTTDDGAAVDLSVQRRSCQDVMSGESFPATAVLRVGTNEYRGCGRHLPE